MKTHETPAWFDALFRELVVALQPRDLTPNTRPVYYEVLAQLGEQKLRAAVAILKRGRFFPTSGEWYAIAMRGAPLRFLGLAPLCPYCEGHGLIVVRYRSGEPFDIAICDCAEARVFHAGGELLVRAVLHLDDEAHRVADREAFE